MLPSMTRFSCLTSKSSLLLASASKTNSYLPSTIWMPVLLGMTRKRWVWPPRTPKKLPVGPKRAATAATASSTGWLLVAARLGPGCPQVRSTRLGYRNWDYICHRAAEVGPLVVGELHFARLACAPKSRPQTMRRAPRTARLGKLCLAGIGPLRAPISATNPRARTPWWLGGSLPNLATDGAIFARNRVPARNADHT